MARPTSPPVRIPAWVKFAFTIRMSRTKKTRRRSVMTRGPAIAQPSMRVPTAGNATKGSVLDSARTRSGPPHRTHSLPTSGLTDRHAGHSMGPSLLLGGPLPQEGAENGRKIAGRSHSASPPAGGALGDSVEFRSRALAALGRAHDKSDRARQRRGPGQPDRRCLEGGRRLADPIFERGPRRRPGRYGRAPPPGERRGPILPGLARPRRLARDRRAAGAGGLGLAVR